MDTQFPDESTKKTTTGGGKSLLAFILKDVFRQSDSARVDCNIFGRRPLPFGNIPLPFSGVLPPGEEWVFENEPRTSSTVSKCNPLPNSGHEVRPALDGSSSSVGTCGQISRPAETQE
jgi:hypothetical protein